LSLSQNDPTDHALAAIASIFEKPEVKPAEDREQLSGSDQIASEPHEPRPTELQAPPDGSGYTKFGPGPLDALRFKWTARRDDSGYYYVDETIGQSSRPVSSGPMQRDEAIKFIDRRERESLRRFEALRNEMISGPSERGIGDDQRGEDERLD
jgi:hypothetical protein